LAVVAEGWGYRGCENGKAVDGTPKGADIELGWFLERL
jgi:hypothetical protein